LGVCFDSNFEYINHVQAAALGHVAIFSWFYVVANSWETAGKLQNTSFNPFSRTTVCRLSFVYPKIVFIFHRKFRSCCELTRGTCAKNISILYVKTAEIHSQMAAE